MKITQELVNEHVHILRGLDFLRIARDKIEKNQLPPKSFFKKTILFFRNYADQYHHYKEEFLMFGFLAQKKGGLLDLEIGSLRHQHEAGRECITRIEKSINGYAMKNEIAITGLLQNLSSFISILSRHIYREDNLFFPMVEKELSLNEKTTLLEQFKVEEEILKQKNPLVSNLKLLQDLEQLITTEF
jgi:hemerythrin-like domain-containing protein